MGIVKAINLQNKLILIKAPMCKGLAEDFEYLLQEVWYIYMSHRQDWEEFTSHTHFLKGWKCRI